MADIPTSAATSERDRLRRVLRQQHKAWQSGPHAHAQTEQMVAHLLPILVALEPDCLGVYWPLPGEIDLQGLVQQLLRTPGTPASLALPWAQRATSDSPAPSMHFRRWHGQAPDGRDPCGVPSTSGTEVVPDVLLVPCIGVTPSGLRLGYGGGFYDRYLAAHPHITAIGVAWPHAVLSEAQLPAQAHDQALMLVVTPDGILDPV
jgi:5-formyltetrahydrofolate cyclo-ligase